MGFAIACRGYRFGFVAYFLALASFPHHYAAWRYVEQCASGAGRGATGRNGIMVAPQWLYRFNNARSPLAARNALGVMEGDAVTFAALPSRPTVGQRAFVTDATVSAFGATVSVG